MNQNDTSPSHQQDADSRLRAELEAGEFDFLDFGCSKGDSIASVQQVFGPGRGLGVDISNDKVAQARSRGIDAIVGDLIDFSAPDKVVRHVSMLHFLEHLNSLRDARKCLNTAVRVAREFVFVRQPFFDADGYLFANGLKLHWSDWTGHPNKMTTLDFYSMLCSQLSAGLIRRFAIFAIGRIDSSEHPAIHPVASPPDQQIYDPQLHPEKPKAPLGFTQQVFVETVVVIELSGGSAIDVYRQKHPKAVCYFDSELGDDLASNSGTSMQNYRHRHESANSIAATYHAFRRLAGRGARRLRRRGPG